MRFNKKIVFLMCMLVFSVALFGDSVQYVGAHPGRTDSSGCHTCRTNCSKWGLATGEYHCHNGGGSSSNSNGNSNSIQDNSAAIKAQQEELARQQEEYAKQQEEYAKQQAEAAEKQRQEQKKLDKELGNTNGYEFKIQHPDGNLDAASNGSESYAEGYKAGFEKADKELIEKTEELADSNAKADAVVLLSIDEAIPEGVKTELYATEYKKKFKSYEEDYFNEVKLDAQHSAQIDVYDKYGQKDYSSEIEEKGKALYQETYQKYVKIYTDEIEELKSYVKQKGASDGDALKDKSDESYKDYKDFEIYKDLDELYKKEYEESYEKKNTITNVTATLIVVAIIAYVIYRKKKGKKFIKPNRLSKFSISKKNKEKSDKE